MELGEPPAVAPERPPEAEVLWALCPRCEHRSTFEPTGDKSVTFENPRFALEHRSRADSIQRVALYQCRGCGQCTVVIEERVEEPTGHAMLEGQGSPITRTTWRGIHWWPPPGGADLGRAIPEELRDAYSEGVRCLGSNAPRAAAVMFRRMLEGVVRNRGSEKAVAQLDARDLPGALTIMGNEGVLDKSLGEWATEVHGLGNKGAHFDPLEDVSRDQATDLAHFARQVLRYLYEEPDRVRRLRESRRADAK